MEASASALIKIQAKQGRDVFLEIASQLVVGMAMRELRRKTFHFMLAWVSRTFLLERAMEKELFTIYSDWTIP